jgi:hypothetical protein
MVKPGLIVPMLDLPLVGGGRYSLGAEKPKIFALIVFYRGLHCPICKTYLRDLNSKIPPKRGPPMVTSSDFPRPRGGNRRWETTFPALCLFHYLFSGTGISAAAQTLARPWSEMPIRPPSRALALTRPAHTVVGG